MQNYLDVGVLAILLVCALSGRARGLVKTCLGFVPLLGGLLASKFGYPMFSKMLYDTGLYTHFKEGAASWLDLGGILESGAQETATLSALNLPDFMKDALVANHNPVVYQLLGVDTLSDYVAGYVAQVCINVLSMAVVFLVVAVGLQVLLRTLDLVAKLPVLHFLNHTAGFVAGLIKGVLIVWILGVFLVFFYANPSMQPVFEALAQSKVALFFYEHNLLLGIVLQVFG